MTKFDADPDVIEKRRPVACPFCGQDGAFDAQGDYPEEVTRVRSGVRTITRVVWSQVRCPECNGHFQMVTDSEKVEVTEGA